MSKLIFFVDDDKMIINLLEYTFQNRHRYQIKSFISGEDCLEAMDLNPDLIVLDYQMSSYDEERMDGLETLNEIRKKDPNLPVIVLTGNGSDELYLEFKNTGAVGYLTKDDYFVDSLMEQINEVLS